MEVANTGSIVTDKRNIVLGMLMLYKRTIIRIINEAFKREYPMNVELEFVEHHKFKVTDERERLYEWKIASTSEDGFLVFMVEHEGSHVMWDAYLNCDELLMEIGSIAVVRLDNNYRKSEKIKCVIDTPGGAVKYSVPIVPVGIDKKEMEAVMSLLT